MLNQFMHQALFSLGLIGFFISIDARSDDLTNKATMETIALSTAAESEPKDFYQHTTLCTDALSLINSGDHYGCHFSYLDGGVHFYFVNHNDIDRPFDKIVIVADGFNPDGSRNPDMLASSLQSDNINIMQALTDQGYSVIIASFPGNYSKADLKNNTQALSNGITLINSIKTNDRKLTVVGISMGGLIARAALTQIEYQGHEHAVDRLITLDSPHKGALMPLSIQHTLKYFQTITNEIDNSDWKTAANIAKFFADTLKFATFGTIDAINKWPSDWENKLDEIESAKNAADFQAMLYVDNTAARQLLINLFDQRLSQHNDFYGWLASIGDYPKKLKKIAFTNGSVTGTKGLSSSGIVADFRNEKEQNPKKIFMRFQLSDDRLDRQVINARATFKSSILDDPEEFDYDRFMYSDQYTVQGDVPGSYMNHYNKLKSAINGMPFETSMALMIEKDQAKRTYIPTYSSLGIDASYAMADLKAVTGNNIASISPFDRIYYNGDGSKSMSHAYTNDDTTALNLIGEITGFYPWLPAVLFLLL